MKKIGEEVRPGFSIPPSCTRGAFGSKPIVSCLHSIIDCPHLDWLKLIRWGFAGLQLAGCSSGGAQVLGHLHFTSSALILTSSLLLLIRTLPCLCSYRRAGVHLQMQEKQVLVQVPLLLHRSRCNFEIFTPECQILKLAAP